MISRIFVTRMRRLVPRELVSCFPLVMEGFPVLQAKVVPRLWRRFHHPAPCKCSALPHNIVSFIIFSVTSVGATQGVGTETAASLSGGGFSVIFDTPSYQSAVVTNYLDAIGELNSGLFNPGGRRIPDVAFNGMDFNIVVGGDFGLVDGTSCSTTSLAAAIGLINAELLSVGKPVLGFLNPFLQKPQLQ